MADDPIDRLRRKLEHTTGEPLADVVPKRAVPPTYPGKRMGYGGVDLTHAKPDPPRPERVPLAVKSSPEATRVDGVMQPAPGETPRPPPVDTLKKWPPPLESLPPAGQRSLSPPPTSTAFEVKGGVVDFRMSKGTWARIRPYVLWGALPLGGVLVGYYQGLKAAAERMRANEARTAAIAGEVAELRANHDQKLKGLSAGVGRAHVLADDHESRLDRLEPKVELHGERLNSLADQKPIIVKPSN